MQKYLYIQIITMLKIFNIKLLEAKFFSLNLVKFLDYQNSTTIKENITIDYSFKGTT